MEQIINTDSRQKLFSFLPLYTFTVRWVTAATNGEM